MPHLFTVRWPLFARLEAVLLFPVAVRLASEIKPLRALAYDGVGPVLSPVGTFFAVPGNTMFWIAMTIVAIMPAFTLLIVADRLLTVRRGFALLSAVAIAAWAGAAARYYWLATDSIPMSLPHGMFGLSLEQEAAAAAACLALLLHLKPMWTGLCDQGEVAFRLLCLRDSASYQQEEMQQTRRVQDQYYRQTADFRGWQPQEQLEGLGTGSRDSTVKALYAVTWVGVIVGIGTAWLNWSGGTIHGMATPASAPETGRPAAASGKANGQTMAPAVQTAPALPPASSHVVATMPLPAVQRPTEQSSNVGSGAAISGPNEAVSERANDGSFAFDAVVNGAHVRMLFDTGASVVGLRAEDAVRLGIPVSRLTYSARIKTANGTAEVAPVMIDSMLIGNITLRNVAGFVAKEGAMHENLLGQTFLARLSGFTVERNLLVLKGR